MMAVAVEVALVDILALEAGALAVMELLLRQALVAVAVAAGLNRVVLYIAAAAVVV
jgi:hypothetical protein